MIKIHSIKVYGLLDSIKSTSFSYRGEIEEINNIELTERMIKVSSLLGNKSAGLGEDKNLRFIQVQFIAEASRYWWTEMDTYHFVERQSQGTLHCMRKFNYDLVKDPFIDPIIWDRFIEIVEEFKSNPSEENRMRFKANLPEGFILTSHLTTNYATLKTIFSQRHSHPLPEWGVFCQFISDLPLARELGLLGKKFDKFNLDRKEIKSIDKEDVIDNSKIESYQYINNFYDLSDLIYSL